MEKKITVSRKKAKKLTVSRKKAKILAVNRKSHYPISSGQISCKVFMSANRGVKKAPL